MMKVSMTLPQMRRGECVLGDALIVRLTPCELSLLALLLVTPPGRVVEYDEIIETLWPDPDTQPLTAPKIISVIKYRLQLKGIHIDCYWGRGCYSIPAENRGSCWTMRSGDEQWQKAA
jgi:DNA-binding winged helix-turn-helix (wHTH) protein